jgi:hypothetical protein
MTKFTAEEFINKYQHDNLIETMKPEATDSFIENVCERVIDYIKSNSTTFKDSDLSVWQTEQLKRAMMEEARNQLVYGPDAQLSNITYTIVKNAGFLYKGLR